MIVTLISRSLVVARRTIVVAVPNFIFPTSAVAGFTAATAMAVAVAEALLFFFISCHVVDIWVDTTFKAMRRGRVVDLKSMRWKIEALCHRTSCNGYENHIQRNKRKYSRQNEFWRYILAPRKSELPAKNNPNAIYCRYDHDFLLLVIDPARSQDSHG